MTPEEFGEFYEAQRPAALALAAHIAPSGDAEDAVQRAALYCLERLDSLDRLTPSYFKWIVSNRCKDALRAVKRRAEPAGDLYDLDAYLTAPASGG